jgi:hypothetical protein
MPQPKMRLDQLRQRAVRLMFESQRPIAAPARNLDVLASIGQVGDAYDTAITESTKRGTFRLPPAINGRET